MRLARLGFAVLAYFAFFAAFVYLIGFVGDLIVPRSIDVGPSSPLAPAIIIDVLLIALFGLQHSLMARPTAKRAMARFVHPAIERALYVLATTAVLAVLYLFWRPIPTVIWSSTEGWLTTLLWVLFGAGWVMVFVSTWLLNHFELFGLQQVWLDYRGAQPSPPQFREPLFYRYVRHPLYAGFLLAFWAIPKMTAGHLLFAAGMTAYILAAIRYEERDLTAILGDQYADYRTRVGMLVPGVGRAR
ncbi:MAG: methanethiol S-methyltransferase [Tsuneonella sp.]